MQQTAVQSAIDEARLRRGISDVFRNLAGRSQSLLHRQLTLLDGMERRATEPDELEDLFRIDHLTTRMRRHAEGLIILSGEAPARGWRQPVPLVDVLRAAVAEVEDYTRIRVLCRTSAAVAGHAVADVIHLIAELAENATVFSPPNTPVRIQGDVVGRGFAVEIEDRGLGISAARLEEINANLANPPQFDLSGSDRLGLFIAGQLAQRHEIKITLRPSVYGGTTAIVLIPTALVVDEDAFERDPELRGRSRQRGAGRRPGRRHALAQAVSQGASAAGMVSAAATAATASAATCWKRAARTPQAVPLLAAASPAAALPAAPLPTAALPAAALPRAALPAPTSPVPRPAGRAEAMASRARLPGARLLPAAGSAGLGEDAGLPGASSTDGRRAADSGTGWDHLRADPQPATRLAGVTIMPGLWRATARSALRAASAARAASEAPASEAPASAVLVKQAQATQAPVVAAPVAVPAAMACRQRWQCRQR